MKIPINGSDESKFETAQQNAGAQEETDSYDDGDFDAPDISGKMDAQPAGRDIEKLIAQNRDYLDHLRRLQAEFENYKKRTKKEKAETIRYANGQMVEKLLVVVDNLQRGLIFSAVTPEGEEILKGMRMVERQMLEILSDYGVKPFDTIGANFDPNIHQPLYTIERTDVDDNVVVEEVEKGYMLHDKLLRPAKVVVSRAQAKD